MLGRLNAESIALSFCIFFTDSEQSNFLRPLLTNGRIFSQVSSKWPLRNQARRGQQGAPGLYHLTHPTPTGAQALPLFSFGQQRQGRATSFSAAAVSLGRPTKSKDPTLWPMTGRHLKYHLVKSGFFVLFCLLGLIFLEPLREDYSFRSQVMAAINQSINMCWALIMCPDFCLGGLEGGD